jgi:hypothetical protein
MRARWKLGQLLTIEERARERRSGTGLFVKLLNKLKLTRPTAMEAQRIGTLPDGGLEKVFVQKRKEGELTHFSDLIVIARPYWCKASRQKKHRRIAKKAAEAQTISAIRGPYPLIYADPPWKFEIYSEKGLERTADQHYPTLSYEEIADFKVDGATVAEVAGKDAALVLSSRVNLCPRRQWQSR